MQRCFLLVKYALKYSLSHCKLTKSTENKKGVYIYKFTSTLSSCPRSFGWVIVQYVFAQLAFNIRRGLKVAMALQPAGIDCAEPSRGHCHLLGQCQRRWPQTNCRRQQRRQQKPQKHSHTNTHTQWQSRRVWAAKQQITKSTRQNTQTAAATATTTAAGTETTTTGGATATVRQQQQQQAK